MKEKLKYLNWVSIFLLVIVQKSFGATSYKTKMNFWDTCQKGANIFNRNISFEDIKAAKEYGIKFIRLAPNKFDASQQDFLIGNSDEYKQIIQGDLEKLKQVLDMCNQENMPVVITTLSLPGARFTQHNKGINDLRIWKEKKYQQQAASFWGNLALELKSHPAVVGYDILNEPHLEKLFDSEHINTAQQNEIKTLLYDFYELIIKAIRSVDEHTPIILESSAYADPQSFHYFKLHEHDNILYSFHMYEPYTYTCHKINQNKFSYPGPINETFWDKKQLEAYMSAVVIFQKNYGIASNQILVGEFGADRRSPGIEGYFQDLISLFEQEKWHFAFYAFREDVWDGMDYELGDKPLPKAYYQALKMETPYILERKNSHAAFSVLRNTLEK